MQYLSFHNNVILIIALCDHCYQTLKISLDIWRMEYFGIYFLNNLQGPKQIVRSFVKLVITCARFRYEIFELFFYDVIRRFANDIKWCCAGFCEIKICVMCQLIGLTFLKFFCNFLN